jgi:hypothetical protein
MKCAYCENLLVCEACGAEFVAATPEAYEAVVTCNEAVICPACETMLVCHWCKTPYDGQAEDDQEQGPA